MKARRWTWAAARSIGTSHIKAGKACEDFGACLEITGSSETVLIAVASDGAGSACHSRIGSWITTRAFVHSAAGYVKAGRDLKLFSVEIAQEWIEDIRTRISAVASRADAKPRDFAATLVGCLIGKECSFLSTLATAHLCLKQKGTRVGTCQHGRRKVNTQLRHSL
jgi:hypothetical protein